MPTRKSGAKHLRADEKKRIRNARVKSALKTITRKFELAAAKGDKAAAAKLYPLVSAAMDKAAKKGIIPYNRANRRKSRLARKLA